MASTSAQHVSSTSENSIDSHPLALGDSSPGRPSSLNDTTEYVPATYNSKKNTLREHTSSSRSRPNYFDLQRLAAAQAEAALMDNRSRDNSTSLTTSHSIVSSSASTSSRRSDDEVEEMEDSDALEDDEIPRWLKDSSTVAGRRPASRNSVYSAVQSQSFRSGPKETIINQRENGVISRNSTRSPAPSNSALQKAKGSHRSRASSSHPAEVVDEGASGDIDDTSKTSQQFLTSLHLMTDDDLDRHLGIIPPSMPVRPKASPLQSYSTSTSTGSESTASRSITTNLLTVSTPLHSPQVTRSNSSLGRLEVNSADINDASSSRLRHKIIRDLSHSLATTTSDLKESRRVFEQEKEALLLSLHIKRKESEARESALREILTSMGVSVARVDRALVQATSQAQVPVFKADERVAENLRRTDQLQSSRFQSGKAADQLLPESLREAMLEGLITSSPGSSRLSVVENDSRPKARRMTSSRQNDAGDQTPQTISSPSISTASPVVALKADQISTMATPSARAAWGSGLVPWMGAGGGNKKAVASVQATSPAAVEADGYFSDGPSHRTPSPSPQRRSQSRSSSISAVMAQADDESEDDEERSTWADTASRGAFGLLGSLAWRRKKPSRSKTVKRKQDSSVSQDQVPAESQQARASTSQSQGERDNASIRGRSSTGLVKTTDEDDGKNEDTVRARTNLVRPQAQYTLSGRDVISALYEAIGSPPVSPEVERKQPFLSISDLPKPDHFKAICLATRIMTSDPASILLDSGKKTSQSIRKMAMTLIEGAREEGKSVVEASGTKSSRRMSTYIVPVSRERIVVEDKDARAAPPIGASSSNNSTAATLSRALGRYTKPAQKMTEPNVTRLPQLFGYGSAMTKAESKSKDTLAKEAKVDNTEETPMVTELEPILAHDVKPPALAMSARRSSIVPQRLAGRRRQNTLDSLDKVSEGEESSGDEFEVYGGKNFKSAAPTEQSTRHSNGAGDALLTDRYGFVYDATPADVRLLRRARKEATHAPACLTGIRVGVRARGGTDSQSDDDKDDVDLVGPDSEEEEEQAQYSNGNDSDAASQRTVSSHKTAGTGGAVSTGNAGHSLLAVTPAKPVAEASTLSAASQNSSLPGPTCPIQERMQFEGQEITSISSKNVTRRPPSTSQTVKRLLGQLQDMHQGQQMIQQTEWDEFLRRRRVGAAGSREKNEVASSASINQNKSGSGLADVVRKGSDALGIKSKTAGATFPKMDSAAFSEEEWHLGGMVGLNQMGTDTKDYQDFTRMIQKGIPLVYRAKIWYECSGAMELNEPGRYQELLLDHENQENLCTNQIDLDIGRTMPTNIYFAGDGPGVPKLRRLLVAFSWFNPRCGYCQGMNNLAATLLLTHATEEEAFWVLVSIIEKILPEEYYTSHLLVSQADQRVLMDLMDDVLPQLSNHIRDLGVDLPAVTFAWFLSLYTDCLPVETLFRVWDVMFVEGMIVLFRIAVAIFIINEKELMETTSPSSFYSFVHGMTSHLFSVDRLIKLACEDLKGTIRKETIIERREKHVRDLTTELGLDTPST